jgi:hypothetical protein
MKNSLAQVAATIHKHWGATAVACTTNTMLVLLSIAPYGAQIDPSAHRLHFADGDTARTASTSRLRPTSAACASRAAHTPSAPLRRVARVFCMMVCSVRSASRSGRSASQRPTLKWSRARQDASGCCDRTGVQQRLADAESVPQLSRRR